MIIVIFRKRRFVVYFSNFVPYFKTDLKKILTIVLLSLLIMQSGGLFVVLKTQQYTAKAVMNHNMSRTETLYEHLTISKSEYIKSLVEKNEIFCQGKMYDIKTRTFSADSVDMMVIHDIKEGKILKKLKNLFTNNKDLQKTLPDVFTNLLSLNYIRTNHQSINTIFTSSFIIKSDDSEKAIFRNSNVLTPPPELI